MRPFEDPNTNPQRQQPHRHATEKLNGLIQIIGTYSRECCDSETDGRTTGSELPVPDNHQDSIRRRVRSHFINPTSKFLFSPQTTQESDQHRPYPSTADGLTNNRCPQRSWQTGPVSGCHLTPGGRVFLRFPGGLTSSRHPSSIRRPIRPKPSNALILSLGPSSAWRTSFTQQSAKRVTNTTNRLPYITYTSAIAVTFKGSCAPLCSSPRTKGAITPSLVLLICG